MASVLASQNLLHQSLYHLPLLHSLYTCVLEAPKVQEARKWLQLAVFCSPLAPGQTHLQLRVYFLNNTPCALQWALTNEQPHGGRLRGPCQLFDFTGARGDQCLKLKYISEGEQGLDRAAGSPTRARGLCLPWGGNGGASGSFQRLLGRLQGGLLVSADNLRGPQALPASFVCGSLSPGPSEGGRTG